MDKNHDLEFTCPKCGEHRIEEVQTGVTVATEILSISDNDLNVIYGEQSNEGGRIVRYQCRQCGTRIIDESDLDDASNPSAWDEALVNYLKAHHVLSHDQLVAHISEAHQELDGPEMVELWNEIFPTKKVAYIGDSIYVWDDDADASP